MLSSQVALFCARFLSFARETRVSASKFEATSLTLIGV
jgi:hypothetical protein